MILPIVDFTVPATLRRPSAESKAERVGVQASACSAVGSAAVVCKTAKLKLELQPPSAFPFPVSTFRKGIRP